MKKLLTLILAILMIFGTFSACANNADKEEADNTEKHTEASTSNSDTKADTDTNETVKSDSNNTDETKEPTKETNKETEIRPEDTVNPFEKMTFVLNDDKKSYTLTSVKDLKVSELTIDTYNGLPITKIADEAFDNCSIPQIIVGNNVKSMGGNAFKGCDNLISLTLGSGLETIGEVKIIGGYSSIVEVVNNSSINIVKGSKSNAGIAFEALEVHNGESKIVTQGDYQFYSVGGVNYLINYLGGDKKIILPESYNGEQYAIYECIFTYDTNYATENIIIPDSVTDIGRNAFTNCVNLMSITIGSGVKNIDTYAFDGCIKLIEVINKSNIELSPGFFNNNLLYAPENLHLNVTVHSENSKLVNQNGYIFYTSNNTNYLVNYIGKEKAITLPENYNGASYIINTCAFAYNPYIESVTIPNTVTTIGYGAFAMCSSLKTVVIPDSVTALNSYMFSECSNLTNITLSKNLQSISDAFDGTAYYNNESNWENGVLYIDNYLIDAKNTITGTYTVKDGTKTIAEYAFANCRDLTTIIIGTGTEYIGFGAFSSCKNLISITLGKDVKEIGDSAFNNCQKLVEVINYSTLNIKKASDKNGGVAKNAKEIHTENTKIVNKNGYIFYTFKNTNYLLGYNGNGTSLVLPENYNGENYQVYMYAFYNDDISSVKISDGVKRIGYNAFCNCSNLLSVTLGKNIEKIDDEAFSNCYKLVEIINHSSLDIVKGSSSNGNIANCAKEVHSGQSKIINKNGYCFYSANEANYLITYTGTDKELILPADCNGATYGIAQYAFAATDITSVTVPDSVTFIENNAFISCTELNHISLGKNIQRIGNLAFTQTGFQMNDENWENGTLYIGNYLISSSVVGEYTIKDGTTVIADYAFQSSSYDRKLTSITLPNSLITIGKGAFRNASLKNITIPESVTTICDEAFFRCAELEAIKIPKNVTTIGQSAFYNCSALKNITFEETDGWEFWVDANTQVVPSDLDNTAKAAEYLTQSAYAHSWTRKIT